MRYFLWEIQQGEGCDYTIGCGRDLIAVPASSKEEAIAWCVRNCVPATDDEEGDAVGGTWDAGSEKDLASAMLICADDVVDLASVLSAKRQELNEAKMRAKKQDKEARERAEFERLRSKYGGTT